jgi:tripartite-type tricarboxylate transporter receptor subunit TctC
MIFKKAGITFIEIPYSKGGTADLFPALLGGHVEVASMSPMLGTDQVRAGILRVLMVFSDQRSPTFPDVPTAGELGYPGVELPAFQSLYCHKDVPEPIKKKLIDVLKKTYDDPEYKKGIASLDVDPRWGGPDFVSEQIKRSERIVVPVLKELGLFVENFYSPK